MLATTTEPRPSIHPTYVLRWRPLWCTARGSENHDHAPDPSETERSGEAWAAALGGESLASRASARAVSDVTAARSRRPREARSALVRPGGSTGIGGTNTASGGELRGQGPLRLSYARTLSCLSGMNVLLTNDDGIGATGLHAMRRALLELPDVELAVIAPDSNRSAIGRGITTRAPLWVEEVEFDDGTRGFATEGTPVDCVRFASLGLVESPPELIVAGINHGSNLGDDITYSGTVAAALEGVVLGIPAIAVSQQAVRGEMGFRVGDRFDFERAAAFAARLVGELERLPLEPGTLLNVNCPAGEPSGARACRLGKRIYRDRLELAEEEGGRRRYRIYGEDPSYHHEDGTDFAAIADGCIAVTPIHFDLTDASGVDTLSGAGLDELLRPAVSEVE